ncbi:MAG: PilW family protein [Burkholderiales bacterium]|jgi:type IV pilus assembly protein PilW|nr:PilW family protein [Burkholderiales bacterium]
MTSTFKKSLPRSAGFTIVEILVGLLIGTLLIYTMYFVFAQNEKASRVTSAISETQMSGMQTMYLMEQIVSDAGSGFMYNSVPKELLNCPDPSGSGASGLEGVFVLANGSGGDLITKPLPAVINYQEVNTARLDELYVFSGASAIYNDALVAPQIPANLSTSGSNTFNVPLNFAVGDVLVGINNAKQCETYRVTQSQQSTPGGALSVLMSGSSNLSGLSSVVNLGQASHFRFFVNDRHELQMDQYAFTGTGWSMLASMILASNIQMFSAQYGIDSSTPPDGVVDSWVNANDSDWTIPMMRGANLEKIKQIRAVRIGVIVATTEPEKADQPQAASTLTLFESEAPSVSFTAPSVDVGSLKYRYRKYEAVIPLRNVSWAN